MTHINLPTYIEAYTYIKDCGDGSQTVLYFSSKEKLDEYDDKYTCSTLYTGGEPEVEQFAVENGVLRPRFGFDDDLIDDIVK